MIRLYGKVRYHWQTELSTLLVYWSLALFSIFISLVLAYESASIPVLFFSLFFFLMCLLAIGLHRYFTIYDDGIIQTSIIPFCSSKILIADIDTLLVEPRAVRFLLKKGSVQRTYYYMKPSLRDRFVDHLVEHEQFQGKILRH